MPDAWGGSFGSSCSEGTCGTGGWAGPKPGDPDNNSILSAVAAYGGIDVSWSYPSTNPAAVAHTLLYRGITPDYPLATLRQVVAGSFFYDRIAKADIKEYFYWIQIVSINGTVGELIGPASATPMSSIAETIQDLTGLIDAGVLAQSLKTEIARIGTIDTSLAQEVLNRIGANNALADAMAQVQNETGQAMTLILDEVNQRVTADDAMITSVNALVAGIAGNYAAIVEQQSVLVDADEALAASVLTAQSVLNGNIASVQTSLQTNINTLDGEVTNIGALYTAKVDVNGLIGGFGIYNDGTEVEAGFDVDRFWIGRTTNKRKPFIIDSGVVYIDDAAINKLTFSKLRDATGAFIVEGGKLKADYIATEYLNVKYQVNVGAFNGYAWPAAGGTGAHLSADGLLLGNYNASVGNPLGKYFQIYTPVGGTPSISTNIPMYIEDLQVGTGKIANNAVTVCTSGSWSSSGSSILLDLYVNTNGNVPTGVVLMFQFTNPGWSMSIERNGSPIYSGSEGTTTLILRDLPGAGNHQYRFNKSGGTCVGSAVILATFK